VSTSDPWSIPRPSAVDNQDSVLLVSGNPSSSGGLGDTLTSIMPMLMMVMMMGMIMPMMQGMGGGSEE
jgi:ATP-dependent Zn protease